MGKIIKTYPLATVLVVALAVRLLAVIWSEGFIHSDDHFDSISVAWDWFNGGLWGSDGQLRWKHWDSTTIGRFPLYSLRTTNSHVLVSGSGSMITGYSLRVRNGGRGNRIEVLNGGTMDLSGNLVLEGAEGTLWVQGAGSELHVPDLYIQNGGGGNEVNISTGALLDVVSFAVLTTNNRFSVTGTGTVVGGISSIGSFYLAGSSNVTEIKDGATIYITPQVVGMNNEMRISGASILSSNTMVLQGSQNRLMISNASMMCETFTRITVMAPKK